MRTPMRRPIAATAALVSALFLAGCSDDDDPIATPSEAVASATPSSSATVEGLCEAILAIDTAFLTLDTEGGEEPEAEDESSSGASASPSATSDASSSSSASEASAAPESTDAPAEEEAPPPLSGPVLAAAKATLEPLLDDIEANKMAPVADTVAAMLETARGALSSGDFSVFESEEFAAKDAELDKYLVEECDYNALEVTAADYEFTGVPVTAKAGPTSVTLKNEGEEPHVLILLRINDDSKLSGEEVLALGEEDALKVAEVVGESFAPPGATGTAFFNLEPGRYVVFCPIPVHKPGTEFDPEAKPHFLEGMLEEMVVTETGSPEPTSSSSASPSSASGSASTSDEDEDDESASPEPTAS